MSTVAPRPPAPPINPALLDSEGYIDGHIHRTRRALKLVDFSAGVITLAVGLLAFLLVAGLIDHWVVPGGLGTAGRLTLFGLLLLGVCWYAWRQFVPLFRSINPVYAAHTIEKASPSLKNSLLNLLLFRGHRREMSAKVYHALEQQAAQRLSTASVDGAIDRTALLKLGYALVAVVAACALYAILSPKNLALSAGRVLAPWANLAAPSRVQILNIEPGDASVARGERIAVSAEVLSVREDESVRLRYSTLDEQQVDESITMSRPPGGARFAADLPRSADGGRAAGVMNDLEYWIEAGDARSPRFKLTVFDRPTIVVQRVHYQAPAYTGEPSRTVDNAGDIRALEGTIVSIEALANQPIRSAYVDFDADGSSDLKMSVDDERATASFELKLRPDRRTPLHTSYALRYTTTDGRTNSDPAQYRIEVSPDYAPEVRISKPEEPEQQARVDETVLIGVEARDPDYAVAQVRLVGRIGENDVTVGDLLSRNHAGLFKGTKMFTPGDAGLKPGDVLEYWAEARDNRRPEANIALSEHRRLRIVAPNDAAQQPQQNNERGGDSQPPPDQGQNGNEGQGGARGGAGEQGESEGADGQAGEDQGQGGAGGAGGQGEPQEGESPEAGDSASAGGQGGGQDGEQSAEQNGAAGQSGADGENSEGSEQQGEQSAGGAAGDQPSGNGEQQTGEQQSGEQQPGNPQAGSNGAEQQPGEPASAGGSPNGGEQPGAQERVSPDGDDDATAIERIREHLQNQDAANRSQNGESASGGESASAVGQRPEGADQPQPDPQPAAGDQPPNPAAGKQQGGAAPERAGAANQDQQGDRAQDPSAGELADGQLGEGQAPTAGEGGQQTQGASANSGAQGANAPQQGEGETTAGADGALNQNNGESPAGDEASGQPGAPEASNKRDREGTGERDDGESANEAEAATADARGKTESDAQGDQGGDRAGGGQRGGGQQADNEGQGEAGSHTASDSGAGQSGDQGAGETGTEGGQQQLASGETGESSGDQAGAGRETGDAEGEQQSPMGGEQTGDPAGGEGQGSAGGQPGDAAAKQSDQGAEASNDPAAGEPQTGESQSGESASAGGQRDEPSPNSDESADQSRDPADQQSEAPGDQSASGSSGSQPGQPSPSDPAAQDDAQPQGDAPGGASGAPPVSGGAGGGGVDGTSTGTDPGGDDPNLLYAREQTDLVLQRLDEQLAKQKVDAELLKRLGWNEDELRRFVSRWKDLAARAEGDGADAADAKQQLDAALRTLGLRRDGPQRIRAAAATDQIRDLKDGYRAKAPLEYMDRVRWYMKGASAADDQDE